MIAGIDGGGTHTRLELRDEENRLLRRESFGPFNINAIGPEAFRELLGQVLESCSPARQLSRLCVGGAGISNPLVGEILAEELEKWGFQGTWKLCGDQEIALRGALDGPGVAVIAGTGSICFGKNATGQTHRCGGYGHLIDDEGSGYALGRELLRTAVETADGRRDAPRLLQSVYAQLEGCDPGDIVRFVYAPETDKAAIAAFARPLIDLAGEGDPTALEILHRQSRELARLVQAVQKQLGLAGCPIALLGGLLSQDNAYRRAVVEALEPLGCPTAPGHDALWGAAQMAWELA